ncbi:MAG: PQQ-binding-like beta-propeller repeat protein [Pirellulales bacterium]|nr:PQQ-binding-like beta-propeller repeat protein [Pirellulales bacterium]
MMKLLGNTRRWQPLPGLFLIALAARDASADWPTYRGDSRRSGVCGEELKLPLAEVWTHKAAQAPRPAWPELPADKDVWHRIHGLGPTTTYDRVFHASAAGGAVYFGSSADDSIYCLDAASGKLRWSFVTEGPVRLAPTVAEGKVFAGSDDGCVYCLDAADGRLVWKYRGGPEDRRLPGNERMISVWPVRCGIVVEHGTVWACAGLFPSQGCFLSAVNAADGKELWRQPIEISPQGYLLASAEHLFIPTGRTAPRMYQRADGKDLGVLPGGGPDSRAGGCFAVVVDDLVIHTGGEDSSLHISDTRAKEKVVFADGLRVLTRGPISYILSKDRLCAIDRAHYLEISRLQAKKQKTPEDQKRIDELGAQRKSWLVWETPCPDCHEVVLAGNTIFAGGLKRVTAISASDGRTLWTGAVAGKAYGLAVGDGALLVSTDQGTIHCFRPGSPQPNPAAVYDVPRPVLPYPFDESTPVYAQAAEAALDVARVKKGYCLVLGAGTGRLAWEIARRSQFQVIGLESDAQKVAAARQALRAAGLYGARISFHEGSLDRLPYQTWSANLVVSEETLLTGKLPFSAAEVFRVLRPCGGTAIFAGPKSTDQQAMEQWGRESLPGWKVTSGPGDALVASTRRGPLPGAGAWNHFHADPGNTASSGDAMRPGPVEVQWFGRPGPRRMPDRHDKNLGPICENGRLFIAGDDYLAAVDAYNGTVLWQRDVPGFVRLGAFRHCGGMAAIDDCLYVASGSDCLALDAETGRHRYTVSVPPAADGATGEWGYVAAVDDLLFGSACKPGATFREQTLDTETLIWRDFMPVVCSDALMGHQRNTGERIWTYESPRGAIINPTIAIGARRIYFVESENPETRQVPDGRITLPMLLGRGSSLVALDTRTGKTLWKGSVDLSALEHIVFLSYANEKLLITGTRNVPIEGRQRVRYDLFAFDAASGRPLWKTTQTPVPDHILQGPHGEQVQHSAIVGNTIYNTGFACSLDTGEPVDVWKWQKSGNCGTLSASTHCIFSRYSIPRMFDRATGESTDLTTVARPGCWINILPAGGLVLIPEQSAGCTCGYSLQTSLALRPHSDPNGPANE